VKPNSARLASGIRYPVSKAEIQSIGRDEATTSSSLSTVTSASQPRHALERVIDISPRTSWCVGGGHGISSLGSRHDSWVAGEKLKKNKYFPSVQPNNSLNDAPVELEQIAWGFSQLFFE